MGADKTTKLLANWYLKLMYKSNLGLPGKCFEYNYKSKVLHHDFGPGLVCTGSDYSKRVGLPHF